MDTSPQHLVRPSRWWRKTAVALALLLPGVSGYGADGNQLYAIGAVQKGLGGAGVASPRDATWALLNPAALVDLDRRVDLSFEVLDNRVESRPRGFPLATNPFAGDLRTHNLVPIPSIGFVWPLEHGTLGFGLFGLQGNFADLDRPRTTLALFANADRRSHYQVAALPLAYSYRFGNGWSLGGAVVAAFTRFRTDSLTLRVQPTQGDYQWDIGLGFGFELGVYKRWEMWSAGAAYTSPVWMDDYDLYEKDLIRWNFDVPQKLQVGVAYRPTDRLELLLDYKWMDWSYSKLLSKPTIEGGLGWHDQHIVKAGVSCNPSDRWTVRGGLSWGEAPVEREFAFANGLTPALAEWHLAAGFSYRINERSTVHASLSYSPPEEQIDNGRGDIFSVLGRGSRIRYQENSLTVQYTRHF